MKERSVAAQFVGVMSVFAVVALLVLNVAVLSMPVVASYGGQWARTGARRGGFGWGDLAFYPQSNAHPWDVVLYIVSIAVLVWLAAHQLRRLLHYYLAIALLPFLWSAVAAWLVGFNYAKCNVPSSFYACANPDHRIGQRLVVNAVVVSLTMLVGAKTRRWMSKPKLAAKV